MSEVLTPGPRLNLDRLLAPRSVAVVGANDRPGSYAAQALTNLATIGFPGAIWGINPGRSEVFGHPCVPSLADLPEAVDAVVVAIPAAGVPAVIEQAGERGCGGAVVFGAGFAEAAGGAGHQRTLIDAARHHRLPVCGPNCNGIVAMHARSALWGDALEPREPGHVALVAQSGNVAVNALASRRGLRFHTVIASGNQAVLSAADYLEFLAEQDDLAVVGLYLEDDCGPRICDGLAACAAAGVRVVVLKVGSSSIGARAATAHSSALAGDQRVFRALMEEAGAIWAADVHDLLELSKTLAVKSSRSAAPGMAIMTCSGGDSAQAADEAERLGLELPALSASTLDRLETVLPSAATAANPLDYTAMLWGELDPLGELVCALGDDPSVGQVLVFYDQPAGLSGAVEASWRAVRDGIAAGARVSSAPTMVCATLPELLDDDAAWRFAQAGIPAAAGLRSGLRCAAAMRVAPGEPARLREIAAAARASDRHSERASWLAPHLAMELLRGAGIGVVDGRVVSDEYQAQLALSEFGGHVALKLSAPAVQHKSELGGVRLGLRTEPDIRQAYRELSALAIRFGGCVQAQPMAAPGIELLIAATTDGVVPALVIGLGGVWTELLGDVAVIPLPASAARIARAMATLRGAPVLHGGRGSRPADLPAAHELAQRLGELLLSSGAQLIECNPVVVHEGGAVALDASMRGPCTT